MDRETRPELFTILDEWATHQHARGFGKDLCPALKSSQILNALEREQHQLSNDRDKFSTLMRLAVEQQSSPNDCKWLDTSILASLGRDMYSFDGQFVTFDEQTYMLAIKRMVDRLRTDHRFSRLISQHEGLTPVEINSTCPLHPYGRTVMICECRRLLGCASVNKYPYIEGCMCVYDTKAYVNPSAARFNRVVACYVPHKLTATGLCAGIDGIDAKLSAIVDNMPMFAKLVRFLYYYADNQYIVREVLGGPYSGYYQATIMLAIRFSLSDVVRVVGGCRVDEISQQVTEGFDSIQFVTQLIKIRSQGLYRGWMNSIVQNLKRVRSGKTVVPEASKEQFYINGKIVASTCKQGYMVDVAVQTDKLEFKSSDLVEVVKVSKATVASRDSRVLPSRSVIAPSKYPINMTPAVKPVSERDKLNQLTAKYKSQLAALTAQNKQFKAGVSVDDHRYDPTDAERGVAELLSRINERLREIDKQETDAKLARMRQPGPSNQQSKWLNW